MIWQRKRESVCTENHLQAKPLADWACLILISMLVSLFVSLIFADPLWAREYQPVKPAEARAESQRHSQWICILDFPEVRQPYLVIRIHNIATKAEAAEIARSRACDKNGESACGESLVRCVRPQSRLDLDYQVPEPGFGHFGCNPDLPECELQPIPY